MKIGSLGEQYLKQSIFPYIHKQNKVLEIGANIGNDYSMFGNQISADGVGESPVVAWSKALNNFVCSGEIPTHARITCIFPTTIKDSDLKKNMNLFEQLAAEQSIQIVGGHTEITEGVIHSQYAVTMMGMKPVISEEMEGTGQVAWNPDKKGIHEGTQIVMAGYAGIRGTNQLLEQEREHLSSIFSQGFLDGAFFEEKKYSIQAATMTVMQAYQEDGASVYYMHDVSDGGIYRALWQLGKWIGQGFRVDNRIMPIRQETIELCEVFDLNPYMIDGTGAMFLVSDDGPLLVRRLKKVGVEASVIGSVTTDRQCVVMLGEEEKRVLTPF